MYNQVKQAALPVLPLGKAIKEWEAIRLLLTEGQRKRKNQIVKAFAQHKTS